MDVTNSEHRNGYFFFCKSSQWSNEEEVRLVSLPTTRQRVRLNDPRWLTRIILGKDMSKTNQDQIRAWATERNPLLTVANAYFDELHHQLKLRTA